MAKKERFSNSINIRNKQASYEYELLDYGCIETKKDDPLPKRLVQISQDLQEIIKLWKPNAIKV